MHVLDISPVPDERLTDPSARLALATERLYEAYAAIDGDPDMFRCPATVTAEEVAELVGDPRSLPVGLVARFILKAGTTWGGPDDLRRVTPRAVELAAARQLPIDRGLLWAKLRWAGWTEWPTYQVTTLREHTHAEWWCLLRSDPRPAHLAHGWLQQAADGIADLGPLLDDWTAAVEATEPAPHHRAATGHLVLLLTNSALRPDLPDTVRSLFPGHPNAAAALRAWLSTDRLFAALEGAERVLADTTDSRRVSVAVARLGRFRARVAGAPAVRAADKAL